MTENTEKKSKKRSRIKTILIALLIMIDALLVAEVTYSNYHIETELFEYSNDKLPESFDGFRIVQVSDYHDHGDGFEQRLIGEIKENAPDIILLTGDLVDSQYTNIENTKKILRDAAQIAPCYMVWGNHDMRLTEEQREDIARCCEESGIALLDNKYQTIERNGESIIIAGSTGTLSGAFDEMKSTLKEQAESSFVLWLNHYPEDAPEIVGDGGGAADLLFCGHAHGGLIRLPFIKGLYAPGQGLFPKYTSGEYDFGDGKMIVSRGVGNSGFSLRMFDSFHLVVCTLVR